MIAAIDPGTSGGIAWLNESDEVKTCGMINRGAFTQALWMSGKESWPPRVNVFIEHVTGYVAPRKVKSEEKEEFSLASSGFAMFNFGKSAGICYGICEAFGIIPVEVAPATWQRAAFVKKRGTRSEWKNALKEVAQRRYPQIRVTLQNADALLILSYATLMTRGSIQIAP